MLKVPQIPLIGFLQHVRNYYEPMQLREEKQALVKWKVFFFPLQLIIKNRSVFIIPLMCEPPVICCKFSLRSNAICGAQITGKVSRMGCHIVNTSGLTFERRLDRVTHYCVEWKEPPVLYSNAGEAVCLARSLQFSVLTVRVRTDRTAIIPVVLQT